MENARGALTNKLDIDPNTVEEDQNFIIDMYREQPLTQAGSGPTSYTQDIDQGGGGGGGALQPKQNSGPSPDPKQVAPETPAGGTTGMGDGPDLLQDQGKAGDLAKNKMHQNPQQASDALAGSVNAMDHYRKQREARAKAGDKSAQLEMELFNERLGINDPEAAQKAKDEYLHPETGQFATGLERAKQDNNIDEKEYKQKKWALKNIYRHIKPEEMGLFLMDFGMRAMIAGESMGDLGALGAAGSGAMGALQERRRYSEEQRIAEEQRGVEAGERAAEDMVDAQKIAQKNRELDQFDEKLKLEGRKLDIEEKSGGAGMKWQSQYLAQFYRDLGYSESEIARILAGGPDNVELINDNIQRLHSEVERIRANEDELMKQSGAFERKMQMVPDKKGKLKKMPIADMSEADIIRLAEYTARMSIQAGGALRSQERQSEALNRALTESSKE